MAAAASQPDVELRIAATLTDFISGLNQATSKLQESVGGMKRTAERDMGLVGRSFANAGKEALGLVGTLGKITGIAGGVGTALAALKGGSFLSGAASGALTVEASLSRVQALAGAAADELSKIGSAVEDAAREVNVSSEVAASGLVALTEQGQSLDVALKSLVPTLQLAKIGQLEMGQAAGIVDDALDLFGDSAGDAAHVVDVLVAASKGGKEGLGGLAEAMAGVAPLARDMGLSFDQTAGMLAVFVQNGFSASKAAEGLRTIFADLSDPASKLRQELFALGDTSGSFESAIKTIASSGAAGETALRSLDTATRNLILFMIQQGPGAIAEFTSSLSNVSGTASATAKALDDNLRGAFTSATNSFDRLAEKFIQPILGPLKDELQTLSATFDEFAESDAFEQLQQVFKDFVTSSIAALKELIGAIDFSTLGQQIADFGRDASASLQTFKDNVSSIATGVTVTIEGLGAAFNAFAVVVRASATAISGALGGLVKALSLAQELNPLDKLRAKITGTATAAEELDRVAQALFAATRDNYDKTGAAAAALEKNLSAIAKALWSTEDASDGGSKGVKKVGEAAAEAAPNLQGFTSLLGLVPRYALGAGEGVERIVGPLDGLSAAADAAGASIDAANKKLELGGGPITEASQRVDQASQAYADLQQSVGATPAALAAARAEFINASQALARLEANARSAAGGSDTLKAAFATLKVTSQSDLQDTADKAKNAFVAIKSGSDQTATGLADTRNAFLAYAEAALRAASQAETGVRAQVAVSLQAEAAALGLGTELDAIAQKYTKGSESSANFGRAAQTAGDTGAEAMQRTKAAAEGAGGAIEESAKQAESAVVSFAGIGKASFKEIADLYSLVLARRASGFELEIAIKKATESLDLQRASLNATVAAYEDLDDAAASALAQQGGGADKAAADLRKMADEARAGRSALDELDQQELDKLASAADRAAQKVEEIGRKAIEANERLADLGDQLQDEIDQLNGNEEAVLRRDLEQRLRNIQEAAEFADTAGQAQAARDKALAEELYQLKVQKLRQEAAEREKLDREDGGGGGGGGGSTPPPRPPNGGGGSSVTINVNAPTFGDLDGLARQIKTHLDRIGSYGR